MPAQYEAGAVMTDSYPSEALVMTRGTEPPFTRN